MMRSRSLATFALGAMFLAGITSTVASTFLKVDIPTLRGMSESVVRANVVDVRSAWNDEGTGIFTFVTLQVTGRLHGAAQNQLVIRVFEVGDDVVAFVSRWQDGVPMVSGYAQGLSRVNRDGLGNLMLKGGLADGMPMNELGRQLGRSGN
jgi:hypothetical protein